MNFLDISQVSGNAVDVLRTNASHIPGRLHEGQDIVKNDSEKIDQRI